MNCTRGVLPGILMSYVRIQLLVQVLLGTTCARFAKGCNPGVYIRIGGDKGKPQSTITYSIQNIHTHSNGTTAPSPKIFPSNPGSRATNPPNTSVCCNGGAAQQLCNVNGQHILFNKRRCCCFCPICRFCPYVDSWLPNIDLCCRRQSRTPGIRATPAASLEEDARLSDRYVRWSR